MAFKALLGRTYLITGASGCLGGVAARTLALEGATVILMGRNIKKLESLYDALEASGTPQPAIYPLDLEGAQEGDYATLADRLQESLGRLDGIIHCAADLGHLTPLFGMDGNGWQRLLKINLLGPILLTQALVPLIRRSAGAVVFFGDSAVGEGKAFWGAYGVSKVALRAYARILGAENESAKMVSEVLTPGPIRSPIRLKAYPGEALNSLKDPEDIQEALLRLCLHPSS
ncbi:MAG: SDR family NAD(P)-dependent oxidoreductase [Methylococcus sp.]|jgi:NAD(P)-dependent dehydrogenase (short-subunit alcohol dehydrogenase family)|nr:MAG: SDR family NAD(P)-dependent oxidoreductase [Methylococcus sp.]